MPEIRPPPPVPTTTVSSVRHVLEQLERERPVAGDDERIGVRVDEDAPLLLDDREHAVVSGSGIGRREVDGRAVAARRLDLERAHALPHLDEAVDALLARPPTRQPARGFPPTT